MVAVVATSIGVVLLLWPIKKLKLPELSIAVTSETTVPKFSALSGSFDTTALPPRKIPDPVVVPPPPPPDPTLKLKRYRFIGLAASDSHAAGIFERNGTTLVLTPGATLEGFTLNSVDSVAALFSDSDNHDVRLILETKAE